MPQGRCLIRCEYGIHCTNNALKVNDIFNPKCDGSTVKHLDTIEKDLCGMLYERLTTEDKEKWAGQKSSKRNFKKRLKINY